MNVKVITRHTPSNYGSILQCIATIKAIESLGHSCEIINYMRSDERGFKGLDTQLKGKKEWNSNPVKKLAYIALRLPGEIIAQSKFDRMRNKLLKLTIPQVDSIDPTIAGADVLMTGSDQVWGPVANGKIDTKFLLDFPTNSKLVSYAASFGRTEYSEADIDLFKRLLSRYTHITVREQSAVDMLHEWGLEANLVLDPTFMLTSSEWNEYATSSPKGKYILIYSLHSNPRLDKFAKRASKITGLPLRRISPSLHQAMRGGKFMYLPTIGEFLATIRDAHCLITDSFHGTALAINFNTNFIEALPENGTSTRNMNILKITGLTNRVITDYNDFSLLNQNIDFTEANKTIASLRLSSLERLKDIIED